MGLYLWGLAQVSLHGGMDVVVKVLGAELVVDTTLFQEIHHRRLDVRQLKVDVELLRRDDGFRQLVAAFDIDKVHALHGQHDAIQGRVRIQVRVAELVLQGVDVHVEQATVKRRILRPG